jgi:hypothetical protein
MINTNPTAILAPLHCPADVVLQQYIDMKKYPFPCGFISAVLSSAHLIVIPKSRSVLFTSIIIEDPIEWNAKNKPNTQKTTHKKLLDIVCEGPAKVASTPVFALMLFAEMILSTFRQPIANSVKSPCTDQTHTLINLCNFLNFGD